MKKLALAMLLASSGALAQDLTAAVAKDWSAHLSSLYDHLHANPELSFMEVQTAARMAKELRAAGFEVTEKVGGTGVVALLKNGKGPLVMMRADMDGLPVEEKSDAPNASKVKTKDWNGNTVPVMHACGHDVHMTSLVGAARQMAARRKEWSGTLMLIGQPAEERTGGARAMMADKVWERFGKPDYAIALHVVSEVAAGQVLVVDDSPYSGADLLEIEIPGIGTHGAAPHLGRDPVVIGSQIVLALQTIVTREVPPRENAVITVGSFHSGTKGNIISDVAKLELTIRHEDQKIRELMLAAIKRVAENTARAAGMPEDKLPKVRFTDQPVPPTINNAALAQRLRKVWTEKMGKAAMDDGKRLGMGGEDFPLFVTDPYIPSVYYKIGATPPEKIKLSRAGKLDIPGNHSPLFRVDAAPAVKTGVESATIALLELLKK